MSTRSFTRRSRRGGARSSKAWYSNGVEQTTVAPGGGLTSNLFQVSTLPQGYLGGYTILRLILRLVVIPIAVAQANNWITAFYTDTDNGLTVPPNLNADQYDYYYLQGGGNGAALVAPESQILDKDIRTARRIRGEDRTLMFRFENLSSSEGSVNFGVEFRALLTRS